jgi:hypothetical protein
MKKNFKKYFIQNFFLNNCFILTLILINILSFCLNDEKIQNIACSSVPFCQRLISIESQNPLYFLDNKTIIISGNNIDKNNILKATLKNYNREFTPNALDLELTIFILKRGIFRVKIKPLNNKKRFELNEEDDIFDMKETIKQNNIKISKGDKNVVIYYYSKKNKIKFELLINLGPFQLIYKIKRLFRPDSPKGRQQAITFRSVADYSKKRRSCQEKE